MKTTTEIKFMILSAQNVESVNEIIDANFDFKSLGEKIAFLKGMFGTEIVRNIGNQSDEATLFKFLNTIITSPIFDNRTVKKTLTIPSWLNELALERNINFSQTLQEALMKELGLK